MTFFTGTANNDDLDGTADADEFDMSQGGDDIVRGLSGDDLFTFGAALDENDSVFGGNGDDALVLEGDYGSGGGVTFNGNNLKGVENLLLFGDFTFLLGFKDSAVDDNQVMEVDVAFGEGQLFLFSLEKGAVFDVFGGVDNDIIVTGGGNDILFGNDGADNLAPGTGRDTVSGGDGEDTFTFEDGGLTRKDRVDGGTIADDNVLVLDGDYSAGVTMGPETLVNITQYSFRAGNDYDIDLGKTTVNAQSCGVDGDELHAGDSLDFDASSTLGAATFSMQGGDGDDRLIAAGNGDVLRGNLGGDRLEGGAGGDFYTYAQIADSTGPNYDTIVGFDTEEDFFIFSLLGIAVQAVDPNVNDGKLSETNFNGNLENAIGAGELGQFHAVVFKPDAGTLAGQNFVIVDCNNVAGYQANEDLVFRFVNAQHLPGLSASDFFTA
jgi:Ca2+-binding RTX toxin-like protein